MVFLVVALICLLALILLATPLWPLSVAAFISLGVLLLMRESKEKKAFYSTAAKHGLSRSQATKWIEYNDKKFPNIAPEWRKKTDFINSQDDNYAFNYHAIKPGSYATKKWTPFVVFLFLFLALVIGGIALSASNNSSTSRQPVTSQAITTAPRCTQYQTGTYPNCVTVPCPAGQTGTYPVCNDSRVSTPTPTYSNTTCNPDGVGGQTCTTSSNTGVTSSHCNSNQMGGYNCS